VNDGKPLQFSKAPPLRHSSFRELLLYAPQHFAHAATVETLILASESRELQWSILDVKMQQATALVTSYGIDS
jgi:hypothetical protein